jgi:excisionase family DNA binding protein
MLGAMPATKEEPQLPPGRIHVPVYEPPEVMSPAQAARLLQVDKDVLLELAAAGRVPGRRVGGEWRFARTALIDWLSERDSAP